MQSGPQRQQIREQLGVLEERLEELGALASVNERELLVQDTIESLRELSQLVHDQQLQKSVSSNDFLLRICGLLVQDAAAQGIEIAVSYFGEGRISMEMAELVMGAIVAGFRSSLKGHKALSRAQRLKQHQFQTASVYLEVRANSSEIQFRIGDDGQGFCAASGGSADFDKRFQKLREHIARCGGWFGHNAFSPCGGQIEFKVPLSHNRTEAFLLRQGEFEALIPSACIAEVSQNSDEHRLPKDAIVFRLHETDGFAEGDESGPVLLRIGVADLQFWISCDSITGPVKARRASAESFVEEGSWLRTIGLFHEEGVSRALPFFDGTALIYFHSVLGEEA